MTRRSFLRNLGLAAAALGVPVALASRRPLSIEWARVRSDILRAWQPYHFKDHLFSEQDLMRALMLSGKPRTSMAFLRASLAAGAPVPITCSTRITESAPH